MNDDDDDGSQAEAAKAARKAGWISHFSGWFWLKDGEISEKPCDIGVTKLLTRIVKRQCFSSQLSRATGPKDKRTDSDIGGANPAGPI